MQQAPDLGVLLWCRMPAFIEAIGIASTRVMVSMARSRSAGRTGAKPKPQLPITTEVMPCHDDSVQYGSQNTCAS